VFGKREHQNLDNETFLYLERSDRYRHGKLFISGPCRKRADNLLRLSRRQLEMVVAILTGHGPVRKPYIPWVCLKGILPADSAGRRPK
jgi:hypothetical protein